MTESLMPDPRKTQIEENYQFFQTVVASLMSEHGGKYALLHSKELVGVFARPVDAAIEGQRRFSDGSFSIQRITDRPVDLGFLSNGADQGLTA